MRAKPLSVVLLIVTHRAVKCNQCQFLLVGLPSEQRYTKNKTQARIAELCCVIRSQLQRSEVFVKPMGQQKGRCLACVTDYWTKKKEKKSKHPANPLWHVFCCCGRNYCGWLSLSLKTYQNRNHSIILDKVFIFIYRTWYQLLTFHYH